ncbi:MAG: radical SAM protein, partial [Desulfobacula sp.]|nr:radical SAM protein [Desulfobacula sp.]
GDRVDFLDEELICLMKESGCCFLTFGVEVISEKLRLEYNRNQNIRQFEDAMSLTRKYGIKTRLNMIAGLPGESFVELKEKLNFIKKVNPDAVAVNPFILGPASQLYRSLSQFDDIKNKKWHLYHFMHYPEAEYPCESEYWKSNLEIIKVADWLQKKSDLYLNIRKIKRGENIFKACKNIFELYIPKPAIEFFKNMKSRLF